MDYYDWFCVYHVGTHTPLKFPGFLKQVPEICSNFDLVKLIGRGTFGVVILGVLKKLPKMKCALKFLVPTSCVRASFEIRALQKVGKHQNVIEILSVVRYEDQIVLIFPFIQHDTFTYLMDTMTVFEIFCSYVHIMYWMA